LDKSVVQSQDFITLDLSQVSLSQFDNQFRLVLDSSGFEVFESDGVSFFTKRKEGIDSLDAFVYRPVYRPVSYLVDLVSTIFNRNQFTYFRGVNVPDNFEFTQGNETGSNAFSMINKNNTDTLVFQGNIRDVQKLRNLLSDLDKPQGEILVKAVVYEVRTDNSKNNAVSLALGLIESINKGVGIHINTGADSSNAIKIQTGDVQAVWSALSGDSRFKLVSSPTIRIRSGGKARFMAGQDVPTLSSVSYQGVSGQPVQNIEYKSSGVILELSPDILSEVVNLDVSQQISSFTQTVTGVNSSPTLLKRELKTSVTVGDDEIIILGGLDEKTDTDNAEGISFFPDFLRGTKTETNRTEIMLMLHVQRI
jgi:type II secretory pathway component GspD/PulD (secretin)